MILSKLRVKSPPCPIDCSVGCASGWLVLSYRLIFGGARAQSLSDGRGA